MAHLTFVSEDVIKRHLSMPQVIDLMEYVFANPELGNMPPKTYVEFDGNDFRAMPAVFEDSAGIKWASIFPKNEPSGRGPNISATIILNDIKTGYPIAIMDGMLITSYRTAAVTGLATKYLSRTNSDTAAFIGCGFQTRFQIEAILNVRDIKHIKLFDLDEDKAIELCRYLMTAPYAGKILSCEICDSVKECVQGSDILTTLTPSREPFIMADWIEPGMHINAIGADAEGKQEFENDMVNICSTFVVDDKAQAFHSGESQHSQNKGSMFDLFHIVEHKTVRGVNGATKARLEAENNGISFFDSTGLAVEDVALASYIYRKHNERKE
jgi:alanine dehydrogenase|tara:strand:- start:539 stop:1516 length:978 start_codon:yes stop_codon:yes gene_type:complete